MAEEAKEEAKEEAQAAPEIKMEAFVFIKPHAITPAVNKMVKEHLEANGLKVTGEGPIASEQIDAKKLIDQHYYAIASKATILKPKELNVPQDKFLKQFGLSWEEALAKGVVFNALDACTQLACSAEELSSAWSTAKKNDKLIKFGGGFYCGLVEMEGKTPLYVFNAFFMTMRSAFTKPGKSIYWYTVEWDEKALSWEDFRGKVLGPTDPKEASKDSLRGKILSDWKELGLESEPNVGENGVHASASPFEAMAERMNWLETPGDNDPFYRALRSAGLKEDTIKAWCIDPQVTIGDDKKGSLFDALEDMDATACLEKAKSLAAMQCA
jgi:nucleoside diphosphate kinase